MDTVFRRPIFLANRHKPWIKVVAFLLMLTFIFPGLTWTFAETSFQPETPPICINQQIVEIPEKLGKIIKSFQGNKKLIIHIQDQHCNYEVQKNIAGLIDYLAGKHGLELVGVEGAGLPVNVTKLSTFPVESVKKEVGDYFVKLGKISGPEFYAATGRYPVCLQGVETAKHYAANRECVQRFLNAESQGYVYDLRYALDEIKQNIYDSRLIRFAAHKTAFQTGELSLLKYARYLHKYAGRQGLALSAYPQVRCYISKQMEILPQEVDSDQLLDELDRLEIWLRTSLYTTTEQQQMDELLRCLEIIEKLLNISVRPEELAEYRAYPEKYQIEHFVKFISRYSEDQEYYLDQEIYTLNHYLEQAKDFYAMADQRSLDFVENLEKRMEEQGTGQAILVTGGYHTEIITHELRRRGISFISVRPVLRQLDNANPYFSLLRNRRTSLEKMLAWNQKYLSLGMYFMEWIDDQVVLKEKQLPPAIRLDYKILQMTLILWWLKKQVAKGELTEAEFQGVQEYFMAHYPAFSQENGALNLNNIKAFKDTILVALAGRENCAAIYPQDLGKRVPSGLISSLPIKGYEIGFYANQQKPKLEAAFSAGQAAGSEDRVLELITAHMLPWSPLMRPGVRAVLPVIKRSWEQGRIWVMQKFQQLQETVITGLRAWRMQLKQAGLALGTIDLKISDIKTWSVLLRGIWRRNSSLIFYFLPYAPIIAYSLLLANGNNPDILAVGILYSPKIKLKEQSPDRPNTTEAWQAFFNDLESAGDNQIVKILKSIKTQYFVQISEFIRTSARERPQDLELIKRVQQKITKFKTTSDYTDFLGSNITVPTSEKVAVENARVFSSYLDGILMVVDKIIPVPEKNQVIITNLSSIDAIITDDRFRSQLNLLEEAVTAFFNIISDIDVELVKAHAPYAKSMALADFLFAYWAFGKDKKTLNLLIKNIYNCESFSVQERMAINKFIMSLEQSKIKISARHAGFPEIAEAAEVKAITPRRNAVMAALGKERAKLFPEAKEDPREIQSPDILTGKIIQAIKAGNAIAEADKKALVAVDTEIRIQCFYECMRTNKQGTLSNLDIFQLASIDLAVFLHKDMPEILKEVSGVIGTMTAELNSGSYEGWSDKTSIITEKSRKVRDQFELIEKNGDADQKDGRRQATILFTLMKINNSAARAITAFDKIKDSLATLENKDSAGTISKGRLSMYLLRHMFSPANIIALSENLPTAAAPNLFQNALNQLMQLEEKESAGDFCIKDIYWKKSHTIIVDLSNRAGFFKKDRKLQVPTAEVLVTDKVKAGPKPSLPKVKRFSGKLSNKDINAWADNILNKIEADGSINSDNQKQFAEIKKKISAADLKIRILLAQACLKKDALRSFNHCDIFKLKELGLDLRVQENDHDFGNIMGARLGRVSLVVTDLEEKPYFDGQEDIVESLKSKSSRCIRNYTIINKYIKIIKNIEKAEKQLADIKEHLAGSISNEERNDFKAEKNTLKKNLKFYLDNLVEAAKKNSTAENIPELFITLVNRGLADKAIRDHWWQALLLSPMLEINQDMAEMHEKLSELQNLLMKGKLADIDKQLAASISASYFGIFLLKDVFSDEKIFRLAAEPQQVDLQQVFIAAQKNFESEENISVNLVTSPDFFDKPHMVEGDYGGILDKILANLVKNAKDELEKNAKSAQAEEKEFSGKILIIFGQNEITVQDNGTGIPAERLRIDENDIRNFGVTTKKETGGSGIGVFVVNQRMESLSGELEISNLKDPDTGEIVGAEFKCVFQPSSPGTSYVAEDKVFSRVIAELSRSEAKTYEPEHALPKEPKAAKKEIAPKKPAKEKPAGPKRTAKTKGKVTVPKVKKLQVIDMPLIVKEKINPKINEAMTRAILWVEQLAYLMDLYMKKESLSGEQYQSLEKIRDSLESKKKEILAEFEILCNIMQPKLFKSSRGEAGADSLVSESPSFLEQFAKINQVVAGISVELSDLREYADHNQINYAGTAIDAEDKIDVITETEQAMAQVARVFSDDIHKDQDSKRAKKRERKRPGKDPEKYLYDGKAAPTSGGIMPSVVGAVGAIKEFDLFLAMGIGTLAAAAVLGIAMFIGGLAPAIVVTAASIAFVVFGGLALKAQQMMSIQKFSLDKEAIVAMIRRGLSGVIKIWPTTKKIIIANATRLPGPTRGQGKGVVLYCTIIPIVGCTALLGDSNVWLALGMMMVVSLWKLFHLNFRKIALGVLSLRLFIDNRLLSTFFSREKIKTENTAYTAEELKQLKSLYLVFNTKIPEKFRRLARKKLSAKEQFKYAREAARIQSELVKDWIAERKLSEKLGQDLQEFFRQSQIMTLATHYYLPPVKDINPYLINWLTKFRGTDTFMHALNVVEPGIFMEIAGNPKIRQVILTPALEFFAEEEGEVVLFRLPLEFDAAQQKMFQKKVREFAYQEIGNPYNMSKIIWGYLGEWLEDGWICTDLILKQLQAAGVELRPVRQFFNLYPFVFSAIPVIPLLVLAIAAFGFNGHIIGLLAVVYAGLCFSYHNVISAHRMFKGTVAGKELKCAYEPRRHKRSNWILLNRYLWHSQPNKGFWESFLPSGDESLTTKITLAATAVVLGLRWIYPDFNWLESLHEMIAHFTKPGQEIPEIRRSLAGLPMLVLLSISWDVKLPLRLMQRGMKIIAPPSVWTKWIEKIMRTSETLPRRIENVIYKLCQSINPEAYIKVVQDGIIEPRLKTLLEKISRHKDYPKYAKEPDKMTELLIQEMTGMLKAQSREIKRLEKTGEFEKMQRLRVEQHKSVIAFLEILSKIAVFNVAKIGELKDKDILAPIRLREFPREWGIMIDILRKIPVIRLNNKDLFDRPRRINIITEWAV